MRGPIAVVAVLVALAAWPAASSAAEQTFCVADPNCSGTPEASVADALAAAQANGPSGTASRLARGPSGHRQSQRLLHQPRSDRGGARGRHNSHPPGCDERLRAVPEQRAVERQQAGSAHPGRTDRDDRHSAGGRRVCRARFCQLASALADATGVVVGNGSSLRESSIGLPTPPPQPMTASSQGTARWWSRASCRPRAAS